MLKSLIRQLVGAEPPMTAAVSGPDIATKVRQMCAAGSVAGAIELIALRLPPPASSGEGLALLSDLAVPVLEECVKRDDANLALQLDEIVYGRIVKRFEEPGHYEACFRQTDGLLQRLGAADRSQSVPPLGREARGILFFFHNMGNDFAHTDLCCELVEAYLRERPEQATSIGFIGIAGKGPSPRIGALQRRWGVAVHAIAPMQGLRGAFLEAAKLLKGGSFDRLVVVSVPVGLSYLSGMLPADRLCWLTMKYKLASFPQLRHRCSFRSGLRATVDERGMTWHEAAPLLNGVAPLKPSSQLSPAIAEARKARTVFYTINREEKIRNPLYLEQVASILQRVPDSVFVWTGRERLPEIDSFFAARKLGSRHFFAGWVRPDDLLTAGDIFLDTPVLSGNVAAQATVLGRPVLLDATAITWVGTFLAAYRARRGTPDIATLEAAVEGLAARNVRLQCTDGDQYVEQAVQLAGDDDLRREYGETLRQFAAAFFFNSGQTARDHFANLRAKID